MIETLPFSGVPMFGSSTEDFNGLYLYFTDQKRQYLDIYCDILYFLKE
jgi:hypothetical protein